MNTVNSAGNDASKSNAIMESAIRKSVKNEQQRLKKHQKDSQSITLLKQKLAKKISMLPYLNKQPLNKNKHQSNNRILKSGVDTKLPQNLQQKKQNFDLNINHVQIPNYDPLKDKNLVYFFQKPSVKKRIASLQHSKRIIQRERSSHRIINGEDKQVNMRSKTQLRVKQRNQQTEQGLKHKMIKQVTKDEFINYIEAVRKRINSSKN